jgi:RHS repeat-associated protein
MSNRMSAIENFVLTWNDAGKLARTRNFLATSPKWQELAGFLRLVGKVNDAVLDWHSEYAQTNGLNGDLGAYVVTTQNTTLYIYYLAHLQSNAPLARLMHTYTMADATVVTSARVDCSQTETGFVAVAWKDRTGTYVGRSTNGGETWGSAGAVDAIITDSTLNDNAEIGLSVEGTKTLVTAPHSLGLYGPYQAYDTDNFLGVHNLFMFSPVRTSTPQPLMKLGKNNRGYATFIGPGNVNYDVNFESGGYSQYQISAPNPQGGGVGSGGNPGNCAKTDITSLGTFGHLIGVTVTIPQTTVHKVEFDDYYPNISMAVTGGNPTFQFYAQSAIFVNGIGPVLESRIIREAAGVGAQTYTFVNGNQWNTHVFEPAVPIVSYLGQVTVQVQIIYAPLDGTSVQACRNTSGGRFAIDNIKIYTSQGTILYKIDDLDIPEPVWSIITPDTARAPLVIVENTSNTSQIENLSGGSSDWKRYLSNDQGQNWADKGITSYRALLRTGDVVVASGVNTIERSTDGGDNFNSKAGNLGTVLGGNIGTLRGIATQLFLQESIAFDMDYHEGDAPLTVQFTDQSEGTINSYAWDFGDSGTSTQANPSHTFNTPGYYEVELTITRPGSITQQTTRRITVLDSETSAIPLIESVNKFICVIGSFFHKMMVPNSVVLLDGEKREEVTDLLIQTPAGLLALTRYYRQKEQPANGSTPPFNNFKFMGLGWTHNHYANLVRTPGTPNRIVVLMGEADVHYTESSSGSHTYHADAGATSTITYNSVAKVYTLLTTDQSEFVFTPPDPNTNTDVARLTSRTWANEETWLYSYDGTGKLSEVRDDGYVINGGSLKRKLVFRYHPSGTHAGQLHRVGDHTFDDTNPSSPTGRYVEYDYIRNKINSGGIVDGSESLLASVKDIRGNTWQYSYYGHQSSETQVDQLNYLIRYTSPAVSGGAIDLKQLTYTLSSGAITQIEEALGVVGVNPALQTTQLEFGLAGVSPTTRITRETTAMIEANHLFADEVYAGTRDGLQHYAAQRLEPTYRQATQKDANGNITRLAWDDAGKQLQHVTDALEHPTELRYDDEGRLILSVDADERKTVYQYTSLEAPRQPTVIQVWDKDGISVRRWQEFTYDTRGRTLAETTRDPSDGVTILQQVTRTYYTSGDGNGLLQTVVQDEIGGSNDVTTTYTYDSAGRIKQTQQSSNFGGCDISFTVYDAAGNVVASICNYVLGSSPEPTDATEAAALFNVLHPDENVVTTHEYDTLARRIAMTTNAGAPWAQSSCTLYDALSRPWRQIANYVVQGTSAPGEWVWDNGQWEDGSGNPISHGSENNQNIINDTAYNARGLTKLRRDGLGNVTLYGYDDADRLVKTVRNASQPDYNNDYDGDPDLSGYVPSSATDQDSITTQNYDPVGNLVQRVSVTGAVAFTVYDALNHPIKTVQNAKEDATIALNPGDTGYNAANDPRTDDYVMSLDPDRDQIGITEYDALGRIIRTRRLLENRATLEQWDVMLYGYDTLGRQVCIIQHTSDPEYDIADDPDLSEYTISSARDEDMMTRIEYDATGRVLNTLDVNEVITRRVYDGLGRQIRTIANYVANGEDPSLWTWDTEQARWEESDGTPIDPGANNDQNIISETIYDDDGRVGSSRNMAGLVSANGYDVIGRQIIGVQNFVDDSYDPVAGWKYESGVWKDHAGGTPIARGVGYDQNVISGTEYDDRSRVLQTRDVRGNVTRFVYDSIGRRVMTISNYVPQGSSDPADWVWDETQWEDGANNPIAHGTNYDQNRISITTYNSVGRVTSSRDAAGNLARPVYDRAGRRTLSVANYVNLEVDPGEFEFGDPATWVWREVDGVGAWRVSAIDDTVIGHGTAHAQNLISQTVYNQTGQVVSTRDVRGTQTAFAYDAAGRRVRVTQAAGSGLDSINYTCFDKAGRVLRTIQNWQDNGTSPDEWTAGDWAFNPTDYGSRSDENLITGFSYDAASRRITTTNAAGNTTATSYFKDGQIDILTDPLGVESVYRYDALGRRRRVVQSYASNGEDPTLWVWNSGWKKANGTTAIQHGTNNDQNIIVDVAYSLQGRMASLRNPRGYLTAYAYDKLGRRTALTNPLTQAWLTAYADMGNATRTTMTYPNGHDVIRDFDLLGRVTQINYGSPSITPNVEFAYNALGNRAWMSEYSNAEFTALVRETGYEYDAARRLTSVSFNEDGIGDPENVVSYEYDNGGLRTKLIMPGGLAITYTYNQKGRLIRAQDWDDQFHTFSYDKVDRHTSTKRPNRVVSQYKHDAGGRLKRLRHYRENKTLAQFDYIVDARGNRTRAIESVLKPGTSTDTKTYLYNDSAITYSATWTDSAPYKVTTEWFAALKVAAFGKELTFTYGTGSDHSRFDVYVNGTLWQSFDGYTASSGEVSVTVTLTEEGWNVFEIRNSYDKTYLSTGYKVKFKQLVAEGSDYVQNDISYTYDNLARLIQAVYAGATTYTYGYDVAGNLINNNGFDQEYDAANRIMQRRPSGGSWTSFSYDNNGNLIYDGTSTYTWDRANRLAQFSDGTHLYTHLYNGDGTRVSQSKNTTLVTKYLLDLQPGLALVIGQTISADTTRYIHSMRGIHASESSTGNWTYQMQDGLGSVRNIIDADGLVAQAIGYTPYGVADSNYKWGFTGEQRDNIEMQYHRARYYAPILGGWLSLDQLETGNRYAYVYGNIVNLVDKSGLLPCETPKGSGNYDNDCINQILGKLQEDANNAELLGIIAPKSGASIASYMLFQYLDAKGETKIIDDYDMDPQIHTQVQNEVAVRFEATSLFKNLCSSTCCGPTGLQTIDPLITMFGARGERNFATPAAWWSDVLANQGTIKQWLGDEKWSSFESVLGGGTMNPYYVAFGGLTVNSRSSEVDISTSGGVGRVVVKTPVEYFDYFDWCFGDKNCYASGTHPMGYRVGHFITLEENEKGRPFNLYSYATIELEYEIACAGTTPVIRSLVKKVGDYYIQLGAAAYEPDHIIPDDKPPYGKATRKFTDDWPEGINLFPSETELPPYIEPDSSKSP